ncbi:MAG: RNA methyltransferase [Leptolyngbyaceae bacterium]|nr:RNA methyltransferase [Leptolyngbyaceae bacterium]
MHRSKERHRQHCFLIEGTHLIEEAIATGWPLQTVCCTPNWQDRYGALWQQIQTLVPRCETVTDEVMVAIATTVSPDGIVAIAPRLLSTQPVGNQVVQGSEVPVPAHSGLQHRGLPDLQLGVALEAIQDPGNVGTIIRSATAGGVDRLWVSDTSVDLDHPKVLRASAGQWFRLAMTASSALCDDLSQAKQAGIQIVSTLPNASEAYWDVDLTVPTIIVAGNEGAGLSDAVIGLSDVRVCIPTATDVESLNVAIAVSLLIFEANRQRKFKEFSANQRK